MNKDKKKKILMTDAFYPLRGHYEGKSNDFILEQEENLKKNLNLRNDHLYSAG